MRLSQRAVFSEDELKTLLPCPLLDACPLTLHKIGLIRHICLWGPLANAESVALVPVGDVAPAQLEQLSQTLQNALGHRQLLVSRDLLNSRNCSTQVLVTGPGAPQRQQLQQLAKQLALQGTPLAGWLLIGPELVG